MSGMKISIIPLIDEACIVIVKIHYILYDKTTITK